MSLLCFIAGVADDVGYYTLELAIYQAAGKHMALKLCEHESSVDGNNRATMLLSEARPADVEVKLQSKVSLLLPNM